MVRNPTLPAIPDDASQAISPQIIHHAQGHDLRELQKRVFGIPFPVDKLREFEAQLKSKLLNTIKNKPEFD
jgi:hypothetical protein